MHLIMFLQRTRQSEDGEKGFFVVKQGLKTFENEKKLQEKIVVMKEEMSDYENLLQCDLDPSLLHLLFSVKEGKIRRPPNAFMLFSREYRKKVSEENPFKENKAISTLLGRKWKALPAELKQKYYFMAERLDQLHKQQYPGYVYNPKEARLRKQERSFKHSRKLNPN